MLKVSVSNLECFRIWRQDDDLDMGWLMDRLLGLVEQTPQQRAGEALHKALELAPVGQVDQLHGLGYRFWFDCDCQVAYSPLREVALAKEYGDLRVTGRADSVIGSTIVDYKTGIHYDPDRLLSSYQWRLYMNALPEAIRFEWRYFVLRPTDDPREYHVSEHHQLSQCWYPDLHKDCRELARQYYEFARDIPALKRMAVL